MGSEHELAALILVSLGYSSATTWACRTGMKARLWIVSGIGILVIALLGIVDWQREFFKDTSLSDYIALAVIPSLAVSLLVAWLWRDIHPATLIVMGSVLWAVVAFIILLVSF